MTLLSRDEVATLIPGNEAQWLGYRRDDVTSTDVSALFHGLEPGTCANPYKSHYELWHEKNSGLRADFDDNERVKWGRRLESAIAAGAAEERGWTIRPMKEYLRAPALRLGSSFDYRIIGTGGELNFAGGDGPDDALLEIKNVDSLAFRDGWTVEGDWIEAPAHIEIQVQHELLLSGLSRAYIAALVGGNTLHLIERRADPDFQAEIIRRVGAFWQSIALNAPPDPIMPGDAEAVIRRFQFAEPGKLLDARDDAALLEIARRYKEETALRDHHDNLSKVAKADLLTAIGEHEKVLLAGGLTVSAAMVAPCSYSVDRAGYRGFRITESKAKARKGK